MDFGRTFTYIIRDPDWIKKVLIGGLLLLIPFIGWFIALGYSLEIIKRMLGGSDVPLPEWDDFGGYLSRGFVLFAGLFIWLLPFIVISACLSVLNQVTDGSASFAFNVISFCLVAPLQTIYSYTVLPMVSGQYASNGTFESMFQFGQVIGYVQRAGSALLMLILLGIVTSILATIGLGACFIGVIFTTFFSTLVLAHGIAQVYSNVSGTGVTPEERPAF